MSCLDNILNCVKDGNLNSIKNSIQEALDNNITPKEILDDGLLAGMNVVGVEFKEGAKFVQEVLMSARAMNEGMAMIKPLLTETEITKKGVAVFATVQGDLHDIGKNLVCMMLEGAGYEVIDLGVDVSAEKIVDAIEKYDANIVGLSAMLTTTMTTMEQVIQELKDKGLYDRISVMIGGAPVSDTFAEKIGASYANDAAGAVDLAIKLVS